MKRDPSRALAIAAGLVIVALTAAAFWLSYAHLAEVALAHGMRGKEVRAWAWPATLDLFIVAGELLMLRAALGRRVDWWAIGLTVVGSVSSIALNVAGVGTSARTLDYVVAAVPPTAALLAFGALMRQIHQALAGHTEPNAVAAVQEVPATAVERVPEAVPDVPEVYPAIEERVPAVPEAVPPGARLLRIVARPEALREEPRSEVPVPVPAVEEPRTRPEVQAEYAPEPPAEPVPAREDDGYGDPLSEHGLGLAAEQFKEELLAGEMPSIRAIKSRLSVGQPRAKEIQDGFRQAQVAWRLAGQGVSS